jgi:hypothetical protein
MTVSHLVQRLRHRCVARGFGSEIFGERTAALLLEAADRIEELEAELASRREDCPHCDGVGCTIGSWPSGGVECSACGGSGLVQRKDVSR